MGNKSWKNHNALVQRFKRARFKRPDTLATYFFSTYVDAGDTIRAKTAEAYELCAGGQFSSLRNRLCNKGFLVITMQPKRDGTSYPVYNLGYQAVDLINAEISTQKQVATVDDVLASERRTQDEIDALKSTVNRIINLIDPPASSIKRDKLRNGGYDGILKSVPLE